MGISTALIGGTIWLLFYHHNSFGFGSDRWMMPHHMTFGGGGMGILMILFWAAVIAVFIMVVGRRPTMWSSILHRQGSKIRWLQCWPMARDARRGQYDESDSNTT